MVLRNNNMYRQSLYGRVARDFTPHNIWNFVALRNSYDEWVDDYVYCVPPTRQTGTAAVLIKEGFLWQ